MKFVELIGRPHLRDAEYIRMNVLEDTDQRLLFVFRFGAQDHFSARFSIHFEIILDIVVSENHRFLIPSDPGQPEEARDYAQSENIRVRHSKARTGKLAGPGSEELRN